MNRKLVTVLSVLVVIVFIGYIILDTAKPLGSAKDDSKKLETKEIPDAWKISTEFKVGGDSLKAVTVTLSGKIYVGGNSFVSCYDKDLNLKWNVKTHSAVTSL